MLALLTALAGSVAGAASGAPGTSTTNASGDNDDIVVVARIADQALTPVTARFIRRAIEHAESVGARYVILELDTPGGVLDSTRQIVRDILAARTKVVVYVSPPGARAASAGLFLALASDIVAMAPGTNIGAAHPVRVGGLPGPGGKDDGEGGDTVVDQKILSDTQAWARSLAETRGRNAELAVLAVSESRSFTSSEAAEGGLVDFEAETFEALLSRLGAQNATVEEIEMGWSQNLLATLASPNLAFILLLIGFYALLFEFYSGGFGVAGIFGAVCIILAFVGLATLPLSYAGLALLGLGLGLLVAEAFLPSYGLLTVGGIACIIFGGIMLVDSPPGFVRVSTAVVIPAALATAAVTIFLVGSTLRSHGSRVKTGPETLVGKTAVAQEAFRFSDDRYYGSVLLRGEYWNAVSDLPVAADEVVVISGRHGLVVHVDPHHPGGED